MEGDPLDRLIREKCRSQKDRKQEEKLSTLGLSDQATLGKMQREAARDKAQGRNDRFDHRLSVLQRLRHLPTGSGTSTQNHVTADKPRKQHRFRGQESEHSESDNVRPLLLYFINRGG